MTDVLALPYNPIEALVEDALCDIDILSDFIGGTHSASPEPFRPGFLHRSLDDDYSSPKRFCTTPERQIVTHGFNSPVSPMALLLNEVDDPGHAPLASSRLQPMGLKLPQQLPPTPQPRPTLMDPQQGLASPSTPSRKNKPQRCSICKGSGHKSRTCKMNPARAAVGAPVDMASAMLSPSETNVLAHTMGQDASR